VGCNLFVDLVDMLILIRFSILVIVDMLKDGRLRIVGSVDHRPEYSTVSCGKDLKTESAMQKFNRLDDLIGRQTRQENLMATQLEEELALSPFDTLPHHPHPIPACERRPKPL
jgi:hypothetical protein